MGFVHMNDRPNLVYIFADQWRAQAAGFAGNSQVKTPVMDRFAERSFQFTNAISGYPVCSPYRAALLTGQYPLRHGMLANDQKIISNPVGFGEAFARAGYRTAYIGKWHLELHDRAAPIPQSNRLGFQFWRAYGCCHNYNKSTYYADDETEKRCWEGYDAMAQAQEAGRFIREQAGDNSPFALMLSWGPPHHPYHMAPERFRAMYDAEAIQLRPNVPAETAQRARQNLAGYYAHVSALDECFAVVLNALESAGVADNTIVVLTSDHGDMLGSQGRWYKQWPWEESVHVPFLLRWPAGLGKAPRSSRTPIDAPDIMPTMLGLCGIAIPETVQGIDFSPAIRGEDEVATDGALLTCYVPFRERDTNERCREYRGIRTDRYTYVRDLNGPWLLYDNDSDPYQLRNLVNDPGSESLRMELEGRLQRKLKFAEDTFESAASIVEKYNIRLNEEGNPYWVGW